MCYLDYKIQYIHTYKFYFSANYILLRQMVNFEIIEIVYIL